MLGNLAPESSNYTTIEKESSKCYGAKHWDCGCSGMGELARGVDVSIRGPIAPMAPP